MSDTAIQVESLSKRYRIGRRDKAHDTLGGAVAAWLKSPAANFRRLRNLSRFDGNGHADDVLWALKDVSFELRRGAALGIIGRNGAGKSTLLKILSRITEPTSGRVVINGRVASLLEVGTGFHPDLTGRENVYLNGTVLGMSKKEIDRKFDEIVAFSEIEKFIDTPVKHYSSGMKVRLAFAVAAHLEPEILVVDEVLAVGDTAFQKKCLGKMGKVAQEGRTVLFVSHNIPTVVQLCDDCIWLDQGRVVERGKPDSVTLNYLALDHPEHADGVITDDMHAHEPRGLRFSSAAMMGRDGQKVSKIFFGDPMRIRCELRVTRQLEEIRLGIGVCKMDGTLVCALHNTDFMGRGLFDFQPGTYTLDVKVNAPLMGGGYSIGLLAKSYPGYWGKGESLDWVPQAIVFQVEEMSRDGMALLPTGGIVLPQSQWAMSPAGEISLVAQQDNW